MQPQCTASETPDKCQSSDSNVGTLSYALDSNETKARIRTYGYEANDGTTTVTYSSAF